MKERKLATSQEAGELADDHIRARKDEESKHPKTPLPTRCSRCKKLGHDLHGRRGQEGKEVSDILLDTGCSRTMVHQDLVRKGEELEGEAVMICCAHGDVSLYPIAEIDMELEGVQMQVKAAVSNTLPVLVLLGTDVPELGRLLKSNPRTVRMTVGEALAVTTRAPGGGGS